MIGSHDTFTYLKPINPIWNLFKRWWKCQCKTIGEQYKAGIRFFDIRVVWYKNKWYLAHGMVTFDGLHFVDLEQICSYFELNYPEAIYRIVLERGNFNDELRFQSECKGLYIKYHNLWQIDIKKEKYWRGWYGNNGERIYNKGYKFALGATWESPSHELHGYINKDNWYKINLKKEAKKINSNLDFFKDKDKLKQTIDSKEELYFLDYCTNEYDE